MNVCTMIQAIRFIFLREKKKIKKEKNAFNVTDMQFSLITTF